MLEETQNKYVGEIRGSSKKTYFLIWKINLDDMKVENVLKGSVIQDGISTKT